VNTRQIYLVPAHPIKVELTLLDAVLHPMEPHVEGWTLVSHVAGEMLGWALSVGWYGLFVAEFLQCCSHGDCSLSVNEKLCRFCFGCR
jgi:hypothetical protein